MWWLLEPTCWKAGRTNHRPAPSELSAWMFPSGTFLSASFPQTTSSMWVYLAHTPGAMAREEKGSFHNVDLKSSHTGTGLPHWEICPWFAVNGQELKNPDAYTLLKVNAITVARGFISVVRRGRGSIEQRWFGIVRKKEKLPSSHNIAYDNSKQSLMWYYI